MKKSATTNMKNIIIIIHNYFVFIDDASSLVQNE